MTDHPTCPVGYQLEHGAGAPPMGNQLGHGADAPASDESAPSTEIPIHVARVVEQITDGYVMLDADDRYVYVNGHAEGLLNKSRKELLGQVMWQVLPDSVGSHFYNIYQSARKNGEPATCRDFLRSHGIWLETNVFPTTDGTALFFRDVTAEQHGIERTSHLLQLTTALASALSIDDVVQTIMAEALPAFGAKAGNVFVLSDDQKTIHLLSAIGYEEEDIARWREIDIDAAVPIADAIRLRQPVMLSSDSARRERYPALAKAQTKMAPGALAVLPLLLSDRVIGGIGVRFIGDHTFTTEECEYMQTLAGQCALALERAQLFDSERRLREQEHLQYLRSTRIENALLLSEERFRFAIEAADMGIWHRNFVTGEHVWSGRCRELCGIPRTGDVSYDLFLAIIHEEDRERVDVTFRHAIETHEPWEQEFRVVWRDNSVHWLFSKGRGYYDATGEPLRYEGVVLGIDERKRIEAALRESELHLRLALKSGKLGAWSLDLVNERFTHVSETCKANFGLTVDAHFDYPDLLAAIHPEDRTRVRASFENALRMAVDYDAEYRCIWPDGSVHWIYSHARPSFNRDGGPERMIGVSLDITERKRTESELAGLYAREHKIAATLQNSLVMTPVKPDSPIDASGLYEPASDEADVGGDFMDTFVLSDGRMALVVGDVVGKGLKAASRTAEIKYTLRAFMHINANPAGAVMMLNKYLCHSHREEDGISDMLAALALVVVNPRDGEVVGTLAGLEPPLIVRVDGSHVEMTARGLPLGVADDSDYDNSKEFLGPGDVLFIASDGITEARHGREFLGYDGLVRLARSADRTLDLTLLGLNVLEGAKSFAGGTFNDDACLLLARRWSRRAEDNGLPRTEKGASVQS